MKLSRREFLKTTAVLSGAVGAGLGSNGKLLRGLTTSVAPVLLNKYIRSELVLSYDGDRSQWLP